jgi:hypothetical protein
MASAKFSAFEFASEEFNSDLARLVNGFTQSLVKLITEECARNENRGEDSDDGSKNSSPFSSPKGKAPRKKAAPKRGRPSKDDTDVVIDNVNDMRSVSDELTDRIDVVRNSSNVPIFSDPSQAVSLDEMFNQGNTSDVLNENVSEETAPKKGKGKATKEPKEPKEKKEKVVKEKVPKEPKEKKEKVVKEKVVKEKVVKEKKEKKEKVVKDKKEKVVKDANTQPIAETHSTAIQDEDDNDNLDAEIVNSQSVGIQDFEKITSMVDDMTTMVGNISIGESELVEETDFVEINKTVNGIIDVLENVITDSNSQEDEIVVDDDMSEPPPDDEEEEEDAVSDAGSEDTSYGEEL